MANRAPGARCCASNWLEIPRAGKRPWSAIFKCAAIRSTRVCKARSDFTDLNFDGRASALGAALRSAKDRWRGQPVAGVLLFTDGNATDLAGELPPLDGLPPVFPVVLGADSGLHDISVDKVTVSQTAFEDAPVTVQAAVTVRGFAGADIRAQLTEMASQPTMASPQSTVHSPQSAARGPETVDSGPWTVSASSNVVAVLSQRAGGSESELHFRFQIHPDRPGIHFYQLEARAADELKNAGPSKRGDAGQQSPDGGSGPRPGAFPGSVRRRPS